MTQLHTKPARRAVNLHIKRGPRIHRRRRRIQHKLEIKFTVLKQRQQPWAHDHQHAHEARPLQLRGLAQLRVTRAEVPLPPTAGARYVQD